MDNTRMGTFKLAGWLTALLLVVAGLGLATVSPASARIADRDCGDFATQAAAQNFFLSQGGPGRDPHRLDADHDGVVCETLPCPCNKAKTPPSSGGTKGTKSTKTAKTIRQWARVIRVVDGDTVDVRLAGGRKVRVRVLGLNTPELNPLQCGAAAATASARGLLPARTRVLLTSDPTQANKDRYGRLLRYVAKGGKQDIGLTQLLRGWGHVYIVGTPFQRVTNYRGAQNIAAYKKLGIWRYC